MYITSIIDEEHLQKVLLRSNQFTWILYKNVPSSFDTFVIIPFLVINNMNNCLENDEKVFVKPTVILYT